MNNTGKTESYAIEDRRGKKAVVACALAVLVPWVWSVWAMPYWVSIVPLVLSVVSIAVFSRHFLAWASTSPAVQAVSLEPMPGSPDSNSGHVDFGITVSAPVPVAAVQSKSVAALQSLVAQWLSASRQADSGISTASQNLHEVNQQSEAAAVTIGDSFRSVMEKTGRQMGSAVRSLKSDAPVEDGGSSWLSLPDFIRA